MQKVLILFGAALLLAGSAPAQTHSPAKPHATIRPGAKAPVKRPAAAPPKTTTKPAATPAPAPQPAAAAKPVAAPVAQPPVAAPAAATSSPFQTGTNTLNLGIGFGLGYGVGNLGNTSSSPAISLSYMRGIAQAGPGTISIGGIVGYKSFGWQDGSDKATLRNIYVGARGAYHYSFDNPRLDTYAGLGLGLRMVSYSYSYTTSEAASGSQGELSGFLGARYFFSDKLGAFSELGYDMSYLKVGLSACF